MPSRYVIRNFTENSYYHVFNRGVEKRKIYLDEKDYRMFIYYMYIYLSPIKQVLEKYPSLPLRLENKNLQEKIEVNAYVLMPNHLHILLHQISKNAISQFMKQITNAYTLYFNKKYNRVGGLFQGRFRAVKIDSDEKLVHVSRYIHLNPVVSKLAEKPENYQWSSYKNYLGNKTEINCAKDIILSNFSQKNSYQKFVMDQINYAKSLKEIKHLCLD